MVDGLKIKMKFTSITHSHLPRDLAYDNFNYIEHQYSLKTDLGYKSITPEVFKEHFNTVFYEDETYLWKD